MDFKETVKAGYNKIAERYLSTRTTDSEDVRLLGDFIELLSTDAKYWMRDAARDSHQQNTGGTFRCHQCGFFRSTN